MCSPRAIASILKSERPWRRSKEIAAGGRSQTEQHRGVAAMTCTSTGTGASHDRVGAEDGRTDDGNRVAARLYRRAALGGLSELDTAIADALLAELDPRGMLEMVLAVQVVQASLALKRAAAASGGGSPDPKGAKLQAQAERSLTRALAELRKLRSGKDPLRPRVEVIEAEREASAVPAASGRDPSAPTPADPGVLPEDWRRQVVLDPAVSPRWPVLKGTTLTVDHIMALYEEGKSSAEILGYHPQLTTTDLLICRACDAAGEAGPLRPP
jgi:uncharacterized protein (DUF433 family)